MAKLTPCRCARRDLNSLFPVCAIPQDVRGKPEMSAVAVALWVRRSRSWVPNALLPARFAVMADTDLKVALVGKDQAGGGTYGRRVEAQASEYH